MTTLPASFLLLLDGRGGSTDRMSGRSNGRRPRRIDGLRTAHMKV